MVSELEKLRKQKEELEKRIKELESKEKKGAPKSAPKRIANRNPTRAKQQYRVIKKVVDDGKHSIVVKELPITTATQDIKQVEYKGKFTRKTIQGIVNEMSKKLKKEGIEGELQVSLKYPAAQKWRDGRKSDIGEDAILYTNEDYYEPHEAQWLEEPKHFEKFRVFVFRNKK